MRFHPLLVNMLRIMAATGRSDLGSVCEHEFKSKHQEVWVKFRFEHRRRWFLCPRLCFLLRLLAPCLRASQRTAAKSSI